MKNYFEIILLNITIGKKCDLDAKEIKITLKCGAWLRQFLMWQVHLFLTFFAKTRKLKIEFINV